MIEVYPYRHSEAELILKTTFLHMSHLKCDICRNTDLGTQKTHGQESGFPCFEPPIILVSLRCFVITNANFSLPADRQHI